MAINRLSNEQEAILKILSNYGCMDIAHLYTLYDAIDNDDIDSFVKWLIKMKRIDIKDERFLVLKDSNGTVNQQALSCLWTMLKLTTNRYDIINSFKASDPAFAYLSVEGHDSYILVPITSSETIKVRAIQEKIAKEKKSKTFKASYVFITSDEEVKQLIKDSDFEDTVYVSYLAYDKKTRIPETKILVKRAQ